MNVSIGKFFKEMRQSKNMTQLDVAERLHLSPQAVSKWERGESLPDITLIPEIAEMFEIRIEELLAGGTYEKKLFHEIKDILNVIVDQQLFTKVVAECRTTKRIQELTIPMDIFLFLNNEQKDELLNILLQMEGYEIAIDEIFQYINNVQRTKLMMKMIEKEDYENLEQFIPFMPKNVRTEILECLLSKHAFEFLEEMLPFLNRQQKELIIQYVFDHQVNPAVLENYSPFFDAKQRKKIEDLLEVFL